MDSEPKSAGGDEGPVKNTAVEIEDHPHKAHMIPVWFFIGVLLLIYGALIFIQGVVEYSHPPDTVLASLHPALWWGALLLLIGIFYTLRYRPGKA